MAKPVWTNDQIVDQLDSGYNWSGLALTYGFPSSASWFDFAEKNGFTTLNPVQRTAATLAIKLWDDLVSPDFTLAPNGAAANVKYMNTTTNIGYAHAYYPSAWDGGGSVWFNSQYGPGYGTNDLLSPTVGEWGWGTYVHETGHALGLDHPGTYNGGSPTYANDALYAQDSQMYTIMSYFDGYETGADWWADDGQFYFAQTPMLHDVMAIQAIYGADTGTRTGNTVYGFNATADSWVFDFSQNRHPVLCIYDSAGNDTIDLSGWSYSCVLNLAPGSFTSADMMTYNISISYNARIENGIGGGGSDTIAGNAWGNYLSGLGGNDTLTGHGGNDTLDGGAGTDVAVFSGARASYVVTWDAGAGAVTLLDARSGSPDGQDYIRNVENFRFADGTVLHATLLAGLLHLIEGTTGADSLSGTANADEMRGNSGNDVLNGLGGDDMLIGEGGNDRLIGGSGADRMIGGTGNDTYYVDGTTDVVVEAVGEGTDTIISEVSYELAASCAVEWLCTRGSLTTASMNFTGNELANTLVGNAAANTLDGKDGADRIYGYGGDDVLIGDSGNDALGGGSGSDRMIGGTGDDTYYVDLATDVVVEAAGEGTDTVIAEVCYALATGCAVETLRTYGSATTVAIDFTGNELANTLVGNAAANTLDGMDGADTMWGYGGNDTFVGGSGTDRMIGGTGNDTYYVDRMADVVVEAAGEGTDTIISDVSYALAAGVHVEILRTWGSLTTTAINLTGNELANTVVGNAAANTLDGKGGADTMWGYGGDDRYFADDRGDRVVESSGGGYDCIFANVTYSLAAGAEVELLRTYDDAGTNSLNLFANELNNTVVGNNGKNVIGGRSGNDTLHGYGGADIFHFYGPNEGADRIMDFNVADDQIYLSRGFGVPAGTLAQAGVDFVLGAAATRANETVVYNAGNGNLYWDDDGSGAHAAVLLATLVNKPVLSQSDFFIV
jgi:serralysin